jgi:hypothetical protein
MNVQNNRHAFMKPEIPPLFEQKITNLKVASKIIKKKVIATMYILTANLSRRHDFPTEESPIKSSLKR